MGRLAWAQLRFRAGRTLALLVGMLIAATAFTVLTATSQTAQLRTIGTVSASFSPAYDILVRPAGSRTALESHTGTVQPDFLSGIYGGITMAQYRRIQQIPGVQVAAPVAMVGYTMILAATQVTLPAADYALPGRQLYRISTTWVSADGTNRITQPPSFLYVTPDRINVNQSTGVGTESLAGGSSAQVCALGESDVTSPFDMGAQSASYCWSKADGLSGSYLEPGKPAHGAYAYVVWQLPMLVAAVDPDAEARLDGLSHAITSGRYLREGEADGRLAAGGGPGQPTVPVLATSSIGIGEQAVTQVQRLASPASPPSLDPAMMAREAAAPGRTVLTSTSSAQQAYQVMFRDTRNRPALDSIDNLWTVGPVRYRRDGDGTLTPLPVTNPGSVWQLTSVSGAGLLAVPMDEEDAQYRAVRSS